MPAPVFSTSSPANGATNVGINTFVSADFDSIDTSSINTSNVTLAPVDSPGDLLTGAVTSEALTPSGFRLTFIPSHTLSPNTTFVLTLKSDIESEDDTPLGADIAIYFQTGESVIISSEVVTDPWEAYGTPYIDAAQDGVVGSSSETDLIIVDSTPAANAMNVEVRPDVCGYLTKVVITFDKGIASISPSNVTVTCTPADSDTRREIHCPVVLGTERDASGKIITIYFTHDFIEYHVRDWDRRKTTLETFGTWSENTFVTISLTSGLGLVGGGTSTNSPSLSFTTALYPMYSTYELATRNVGQFLTKSGLSSSDIAWSIFLESDYLMKFMQACGVKHEDFQYPTEEMKRWVSCAAVWKIMSEALGVEFAGEGVKKTLGDFSIDKSSGGSGGPAAKFVDRLVSKIDKCMEDSWYSINGKAVMGRVSLFGPAHVPRRIYAFNTRCGTLPPIINEGITPPLYDKVLGFYSEANPYEEVVHPSPSVETQELEEHTAGENLLKAEPVYNTGSDVQKADATSNPNVIGLMAEDLSSGSDGDIVKSGPVQMADWSTVTDDSSTLLTPCVPYFLSDTVGKISKTRPSGSGDTAVVVGTAADEDKLIVKISNSYVIP